VAINLEALQALEITDMRFAYGERETMLYALSIGMGRDLLDLRELPFVYEGDALQAVPTMAVVLASTGIIRKTGVDFTKVLHGEQRLTLHRCRPQANCWRIHASAPSTRHWAAWRRARSSCIRCLHRMAISRATASFS
jgi:hypothetical protein